MLLLKQKSLLSEFSVTSEENFLILFLRAFVIFIWQLNRLNFLKITFYLI